MGDIVARPSFVTLSALGAWLCGGKGMSPSAAIEPQLCLFPAVSAVLYSDLMLHWDAQVPGVPMDLVGAAISGSCEAVSQHARSMKGRFISFYFF